MIYSVISKITKIDPDLIGKTKLKKNKLIKSMMGLATLHYKNIHKKGLLKINPTNEFKCLISEANDDDRTYYYG